MSADECQSYVRIAQSPQSQSIVTNEGVQKLSPTSKLTNVRQTNKNINILQFQGKKMLQVI